MTSPDLPDLSRLVEFDDRLREVATDPVAVVDAIVRASVVLERAEDGPTRVRLLGYIGNAERALGRPREALASLHASLDLAEALGDRRGAAVALIRIGEAHRCADELDESERALRAALRAIDDDADLAELRDFALQHLGKCLVEQGRAADAMPLLEEALERRSRKSGAADLVASTTAALEWAREQAARTST